MSGVDAGAGGTVTYPEGTEAGENDILAFLEARRNLLDDGLKGGVTF